MQNKLIENTQKNLLSRYGSDSLTFQKENLARVTAVHRDRYEIVTKNGFASARLKTKEYYLLGEDFPTVGDYVEILPQKGSDCIILATIPRKSFFARRDPDPNKGMQAVCANVDTVFLLQSANRDFNQQRLIRYLTVARSSGAEPVILLTKTDLTTDPASYLSKAEEIADGVPVYPVSALTGAGLDALAPYLSAGQTVAFLGSSGVGKSSLLNALAGESLMETGGIRKSDDKGRHTTVHRQMFLLPNGALIIDTPGMRELGLWKAEEGLEQSFADLEALAARCRFSDCRHQTEPGCAVKAAIQSGALDPKRLETYLNLKWESDASTRADALLQRKQEKFKQISKNRRRLQQSKGRR